MGSMKEVEITVAPGTQWCYVGKKSEVYVMSYHGLNEYSFDKISKSGKVCLSDMDPFGRELILQLLN